MFPGDGRWPKSIVSIDSAVYRGLTTIITFCIFPGLLRRNEAITFRTINDTQGKMSTSLVGSILLTIEQNASPHVRWAWDLGRDAGSPFNHLVWTGGRGNSESGAFIDLRGLNVALRRMMPSGLVKNADPGFCYLFARNYWLAVKDLWPIEFDEQINYKLQTTAG